MTQDDDASTAAAAYFDAWLAGDFARLRSVLADDVANWMQVHDGKITRIRVAFDPRGILAGS